MRISRLLASTALVFACSVSAALAQQQAGTPLKVTAVEGITEYRLSNGLRVLLFPDLTKSTTTVNITYMVGSRHENYGETGMAHLLEHLVFKGTPKHPNIPQELTEHGARPNGSTWLDRTNYFETFSSTDENLTWALDLEADRMIHSHIARKDLDSEMTVVRNELERGENSPSSILRERAISTAYLWHNYGKDTIGAVSDLEGLQIERLQAFYRNYYQPDNAVLIVAGKVDEPKTLALIQDKFGAIPKPTRQLTGTYTAEPTQDGERTVTLRRVGDVQALCVVYHIPAGSHPDFPAMQVALRALSNAPSGRLYKALVESKQATNAGGFAYQTKEPGVAVFTAQVLKDASLDTARTTLLKTIDDFVQNPATTAEVNRAKSQLLKSVEMELTNSEGIGLELSEWVAQGDWRLYFLHRDRLKQVTPADVARVSKAYFKESNRTVAQFIPDAKPDRAAIPAAPDVVALLKDYKGGDAIAQGEAFDASPANIAKRSVKGAIQGGPKLVMLSKKTRGNAVYAALDLHFGDEKSLQNRTVAASMVGSLLMRGTTQHTRQQIQDELDRLKARVMIMGSATGATANIETTRQNLPAVLTLVAEMLKQPSFPETEFEQARRQRVAAAENMRSEPQMRANILMEQKLNPYTKGDVRYVPSTDEQLEELKALKLEDVKKFYTDFYGASNSELAVVGDFDAEQVQQSAVKLFGDWKSKSAYQRVPRPYQKVASINESIVTPDKANAFFYAALAMPVSDKDPDYPALVFGNYMFGGGFLNSRLATRIRQKEGLSYGVSSRLSASSLDNRGDFMMMAISNPQNSPKVEKAFQEELARALKDGFTEEEVAKAKTGWIQSQQVNRSQDQMLVRKLAGYEYLNRPITWDAELEAKVQALTAADVQKAMRKHIDPANILIVKAGDFK